VFEGTTLLATVTLAVSLFFPWYSTGGVEFYQGHRDALQGGGFANRLVAPFLLISAFILIAAIVVGFRGRRFSGGASPPALCLALATVDLALTLLLYLAPAAPVLPHGSLSQSPGVYLGLIASIVGLLSTVPLQRIRQFISQRSENNSLSRS
jgi:hypothetical protein